MTGLLFATRTCFVSTIDCDMGLKLTDIVAGNLFCQLLEIGSEQTIRCSRRLESY